MEIGDEIIIISNLEICPAIVITKITEFHYNGYMYCADISDHYSDKTTLDMCITAEDLTDPDSEWVFISSLVEKQNDKLILTLTDE